MAIGVLFVAIAVGSFAPPAHAGFSDFLPPLPPLPPLPSFGGSSSNGSNRTTNNNYYNNSNVNSPGGTVYVNTGTTVATPAAPSQTQTQNTYVNVQGYTTPSYAYSSPVVYNAPTYVYSQPTYPVYNSYPSYSPTYYLAPLSVSCGSNSGQVPVGAPVSWTAYATGGAGGYIYSWNGTDGLYGQGQTITYAYNNPGSKYATVTVYSGGQSFTANCAPIVSVIGPIYIPTPIPVPVPANNGLDVGCYADPKTVAIGQPTSWNVEVTGGFGPYAYNWSGSENLVGNQASVVKFYGTPGTKSAIVTVVSADGRTVTRACSNAVTVKSNYVAPKPTPKPKPATPVAPAPAPNQASALLSLQNVPWGWVAILVILVLFAMVLYLVFNRKNI